MLERLQQQLRDIYQTDSGYDIRDFLVTDARVAQALTGSDPLIASGESLLLCEDEDGLALSLYLDEEVLGRLDSVDPTEALQAGLLNDLCKVIEGLSHFEYVAWRAHCDQTLSLLELELQAEIDKYVSTMQLAREEQDANLMTGLHNQLFDEVRFYDHLTREQHERYRAASNYAARFCRRVGRALMFDEPAILRELRSFYRMPLNEKISYIHTSTWA